MTTIVPPNWRVPGVHSGFDLISGNKALVPLVEKIAIIAQMDEGNGSAELLKPIQVFQASEALTLFGAHSIAYLMCEAIFGANRNAPVTVCPMDLGTGVLSTKTITMTVEETGVKFGITSILIGNVEVSVSVADGATDDEIATALAAAITAEPKQPYTAAAVAEVITLTGVNYTVLNDEVKVQAGSENPSGITMVIAAGTAGSGDSDIAAAGGALEKLFPGAYTMYLLQFNDATNLGDLKDQIGILSEGLEQRGTLGIFGFTGENGNIADIQTLCGVTMNDYRMIGAYNTNTNSICYELAAELAGLMATQPRPGDPIDDYILPDIHVPDVDDRMIVQVIQSLLLNGVTPIYTASERMAISMVRTCYTENPGGGYVDKLIDFTTPRSLDFTRLQTNNMAKNNYKNRKNNKPTRDEYQRSVYWILKDLETKTWEITQNVDENKDGIVATPDGTNVFRMNCDVPADIVPGLHLIVNTIRLL